jgi:CHASE2 domain-containing sensor protein
MSTAGGPYVGLDYFGEEDAEFFFGRDSERRRIIGNLRASRLTLLYAESGVGKSSLLRAGVLRRIRKREERNADERGPARYVPVVFSTWRGDATAELIAALEAAARPLLGDDDELEPRRDALEHAIEDVARTVDATPLLILDQFEEHFVYEPDDGDGFDDDLARCVNRRDLRAHFLISIREDAYSLIGSRYKARIPNVYGNFLRLDFLDERAAREAVVEPVAAFNERLAADAPRFEIEPALVDAVVDQVRRGRVRLGDRGMGGVGAGGPVRVETAYLQLVMKRLWDEEVAAESHLLRLETLRRLGGADAIVHGHLDDVMAKLRADQRDAAATALRYLVTSAGRKIALSSDELREFSEVDRAVLEPAIEHLEHERILRPVPSAEPGGVARHEIYHDVLAPAIREWRRADTERRLEQVRRRARRLEVRNRVLAVAVIALAAAAVGLVLYVWNPEPVRRLELQTVDARFSVRGTRAVDPRLVLIAVDDKSLKSFGAAGGKLPRATYARLIDRVYEDGPGVIALDAIFARKGDRRGDRALFSAIRRARDRLVVAYSRFTVVPEPDGTRAVRADLLGRPDSLRRIGVRTGWAGLPDDEDKRNRRAAYLIDLIPSATLGPVNVRIATFAFTAADVARDGMLKGRVRDLPTASRRAWGGQGEQSTWIDFTGPPGTVPRMSARDVVAGDAPPGAFRHKIVVIGLTARGNPDVRQTPLSGERGMPGAEVQANAIETMVRDEPLRNTSPLVDVLVIILVGALPAVAGLSHSRALRVAAIAAIALAFLAAAQLTFHGGRIMAVVSPLAALVVATSGVAMLYLTRAVRQRRAPQAPG